MLKLAWRNLFRQRGRNALTFTVIVVGVVAVVLSGGFIEDIFTQLREATIHSRIGHLQLLRADYRTHGQHSPFEYMIENADSKAESLGRLAHVVDVLRRLNFSGLLNNGRADTRIIGEGIEPAKEAELGSFLVITEGRQLMDSDETGILVGEGVARSLRVVPGDVVTLLLSTADGAMNSLEFDVVGVFRTFSKDYDARAVRVPLWTAQELVQTSEVHSLVFSLDDTLNTEDVAALLEQEVDSERFEIATWWELDDFYPKAVALYERQFGVFQLIILAMVILSVANSINMTAFERIGEFGTIRALGYRRGHIVRLLITENVLLGVSGALAGVVLGVLLAILISEIGIDMPPPPNANSGYTARIQIIPLVLGSAFMIGVVGTVVSTLFPARYAARVPVVDALRQNV